MKKKKLILMMFLLVFFSMNVQGIIVSSPEIITRVGEIYYGDLNITYDNSTPHTFNIYNITLENVTGFQFSKVLELSYNETKTLNFSYLGYGAEKEQKITKMQYAYLTSSTSEPISEQIDIITHFTRPNVTIRQNDTIVWKNMDIHNHTVTNIADLNDRIEIKPNEEYNRTFPNTGMFQYFDEYTQAGGYIYIISNEVELPTHSPSYDRFVAINLTVYLRNATMDIIMLPDTFSILPDKTKTGLIQITGNDTLYNVTLTGEWYTFSENNFMIEDEKTIMFNITPEITKTEETDQEYKKTITIRSLNGGIITKETSVFVEFKEMDALQEQLGDVVLIPMNAEQTYAYCNKPEINWTGICQRWIKNETYPVNVPVKYYPEINETEAKKSLDASQRAEEGVNRVSNKVEMLDSTQKRLSDTVEQNTNMLNTFMKNYSQKMDLTYNEVKEKRKDSEWSLFMWVMLLIIGGIVGLVMLIRWRIRETRKPFQMKY